MTYTPMIQQYLDIKSQNPDCILFFRLGDFYEMFFDDAIIASKELEIVLTQRDCGNNEKCPMCGVPYHVSDVYLKRLVSKGYKVAICEQLENPSEAKGLVKRGIIQIVTPGTLIEKEAQSSQANYLLSIYDRGQSVGLALIDISTGHIKFTQISNKSKDKVIDNEIMRIMPTEIIINKDSTIDLEYIQDTSITISKVASPCDYSSVLKKYLDFDLTSYSKYRYGLYSLASLIEYIYRYRDELLNHITTPYYYEINDFLEIDSHSIQNLEILKNLYTGSKKGSLFDILDITETAMGSRLLKTYLERPLLDRNKIMERQYYIGKFKNNISLTMKVREYLKKIYDLERIIGKLSYGQANGKDLIALRNSIKHLPDLVRSLNEEQEISKLSSFDTLEDIFHLIQDSIVEEPPLTIMEGELIKAGFNESLDILRANKINGQEALIQYEKEQRDSLRIKNLKIIYNKKLGYFIDITKSNLTKVPPHYVKKQTLTNSERFSTDELEKIESMILSSEDEIMEKEYEIFQMIRKIILDNIIRIQDTAKTIATIDVYATLALVAYENNYIKPQINTQGYIEIIEGRHPIVEKSLTREDFISNNTSIGNGKDNIQIITGPNMSGKSTYLRQIALISLMTQIGSFIPAESANISIVDKIFTRIGASDNLYRGESTFMVEMNEMSYIIEHATENSLLILDEVGRGTSTYDGLSIAWSIIEFISKKIKAKTLFATHYHELTDLEEKLNNVINLKVQIDEENDRIIFLRKIIRGSSDRSYGIEVARLAGLPERLTKRASQILKEIETEKEEINLLNLPEYEEPKVKQSNPQIDELNRELSQLDIYDMTPIDALNRLNEFILKAKRIQEEQ